jgi:hypothetical protein
MIAQRPSGINDLLTLSRFGRNHFPPSRFLCRFLQEDGHMAEARSASSSARFYGWPAQDQQPLTLLRRLIIEIEDSINQSRAVILSTRDAIELLERLQRRQFSN